MVDRALVTRSAYIGGGVVAGYLFCLVTGGRERIDFVGEVSLGNVLQVITTIVVALLISAHFQRQTASERKEKDIIFRYVDLALAGLADFLVCYRGGVLNEINAALKHLRENDYAISDLFDNMGLPAGKSAHNGVDHLISEIRKLATTTPVEVDGTPQSIVVKDGKVTYSEENLLLIETKTRQLRRRYLQLQLAVNRE